MATTTTKLEVSSRAPEGSRSARRLRRSGRVPGVLYGGGEHPLSFSVDARELRVALADPRLGLDERQVRQIEREGLDNDWPPL